MSKMGEPNGVLVTIGKGGWSVRNPNKHDETGRVTQSGTISGYGDGWQEHILPGVPIVDARELGDKLLKWSLQSPMVDPDLEGIRGAKVEQNLGGINEHPSFPMVASGLHPTVKTMLALGNLEKCSVEEYVQLATEYGCKVTYYERSAHR